MKNSVFALLVGITALGSISAHAAQHDHDTLFSQDNAIMAAAAVETVNQYCLEYGTMSSSYVEKQSAVMRETIEGLSADVLGEEFQFSEQHEMYQEGIAMGKQLIDEAEQKGHVKQMCTQPTPETTL
ncbi:hypothetical protein J4N42_14480 [Vibrio sp. SCSIO 43135]|uniref:hypothetical protein n=1 Tax=Vibrio sp. SCSIO 43135 TaxID=2819096 RepID=UPI0020762B73|nr:hypothetical protein [Vibrio sp. SCSIO 43135]USD43385.1 hypothetical protein J4N42_14480 [Vibrio sp. SCSIO 43135]